MLAPFTTTTSRAAADDALAPLVTPGALEAVVAAVPEEWLTTDAFFSSVAAARDGYVEHLLARLTERAWVP